MILILAHMLTSSWLSTFHKSRNFYCSILLINPPLSPWTFLNSLFLLLINVKRGVLNNFSMRQIVRETPCKILSINFFVLCFEIERVSASVHKKFHSNFSCCTQIFTWFFLVFYLKLWFLFHVSSPCMFFPKLSVIRRTHFPN